MEVPNGSPVGGAQIAHTHQLGGKPFALQTGHRLANLADGATLQ